MGPSQESVLLSKSAFKPSYRNTEAGGEVQFYARLTLKNTSGFPSQISILGKFSIQGASMSEKEGTVSWWAGSPYLGWGLCYAGCVFFPLFWWEYGDIAMDFYLLWLTGILFSKRVRKGERQKRGRWARDSLNRALHTSMDSAVTHTQVPIAKLKLNCYLTLRSQAQRDNGQISPNRTV
jgi:hypothetical protein